MAAHSKKKSRWNFVTRFPLISKINAFYLQNLTSFPKVRLFFRWFFRAILIVFFIDFGYLIAIWPDWKWVAEGPIVKSAFIEKYERESWQNRRLPQLHWQPVSWEEIPDHMVRAVLTAEDARFYTHDGIDTVALKKAMEYNWSQKRFVYGASTITQQTVKNYYLSASRNPLRKWHELLLTFAMEQNLKKSRILTLYLNVAEFGPGIYGVEAAAQRYWGVSAKNLSNNQAIELAATLPAPKNHNPHTRTTFFKKQKAKIKRNLG